MKQRIPQLDAVRGIAILIVMVHNASHNLKALPLQSFWEFGWMGVDLFFVLSGFLITGILLDSKESDGYFKNFYARRCLRIWPLYFSVLLLMFVVIPLMRPSIGLVIAARSTPRWSYLVFLQNFLVGRSTSSVGPLSVTWSVAIEEQFYVLWAVAVRFGSASQLRWSAISVVCLSPLLRFYLLLHHVDLYSNLFCRMDGLMLGGLLALMVRSGKFQPSRFIKAAWIGVLVVAPLACAADGLQRRWIAYSLSSLASAAFVYLALFAGQRWFQMAMKNRMLIFTGTISYGLYLLHKLPFDAEVLLHLDRHPILALLAGLVASYAMATASWYLFEKPILKLKRFFQARPEPLQAAERQLAPAHP